MLIAAPASGQGKTTVTAALARFHTELGRRVRVFKAGPDFLDPMILERASGNPVYQLDLWMVGERQCRQLLYEAAGEADLILIEGVMGLFDGEPSSADLSTLFGIPALAVIDASAMAQTFGAVAYGLATYRAELPVAGVFANRVAGDNHYQMLAESLPPELTCVGWMARDPSISLPDRHLGLVQADEIEDLDARISRAAASLGGIEETLPAPIAFQAPQEKSIRPLLEGVRIAVARDQAFAFLYRANLDLLRAQGAKLSFFSPLSDAALPETDALYLPGGYPELHLDPLAANQSMKASIRKHYAAGKSIVAECGGMLYLLDSLSDVAGHCAPMVGLLSGLGTMRPRLTNLGLHQVQLPEGEVKGHTFHHSQMECELQPICYSQPTRSGRTPEPVYRQGRMTASYVHFYFPSNPEAIAQLFLP